MDRLDSSLDSLVRSRPSSAPKKSSKKEAKKGKGAVKSSSSRSSVKKRPERELKQPTAKQVINSLSRSAPDSVLSRLGPKQEGTAVIISNLAYNISAGDVRELCATVGPTGKIFVHPASGRADVWFVNKEDALRCAKRYHRVTLDGRPMRVTLKDEKATSSSSSSSSSRLGSRDRDSTWGNDRGGSRGGPTTFSVTMTGLSSKDAEPKQKQKQPRKLKAKKQSQGNKKEKAGESKQAVTGADLDADMDSYFSSRPAKQEPTEPAATE